MSMILLILALMGILLAAILILGFLYFLYNKCCGKAYSSSSSRVPTIENELAATIERQNQVLAEQQKRAALQEQYEYRKRAQEKHVLMRSLQQELVRQFKAQNSSFTPAYHLLICVDATPTHIGGYCLNFVENTCYCYTFPKSVLPWELRDGSLAGDSAEFEMKNLLFALLLFESQIKEYKYVELHTDNHAIYKNAQNEYGLRASNFIRHLRLCEGILSNKDIHVHTGKSPEEFARFIQPADDLSRWELDEARNFLREVYGIQEFKMTHQQQQRVSGRSYARGPHCEPTHYYQEYIKLVHERVKYWKENPCTQCGFMVEDTASLRSFS